MYLVKVVEISAGLLLLSGIAVPFALTLLAPIINTIMLFHLTLDPSNMLLAVLITILELGLVCLL